MKLTYYMGNLYTLSADGDAEDALVIIYDKKRCIYVLPPGLQVAKDVGIGGALVLRGKYDVPAESVQSMQEDRGGD